MMKRRDWLQALSASFLGAASGSHPAAAADTKPAKKPLDLSEYEPHSMLQVHETHVDRARYPAIDIHAHLSHAAKSGNGVELTGDRTYTDPASALLPLMDRKNLRALTNLTGGYGKGLEETIARYDRANPGRF